MRYSRRERFCPPVALSLLALSAAALALAPPGGAARAQTARPGAGGTPVSAVAAEGRITLRATPCLTGVTGYISPAFAIRIKNPGPAVSGAELTLAHNISLMKRPAFRRRVDLPAYGETTVFAYPKDGVPGGCTVRLSGPWGVVTTGAENGQDYSAEYSNPMCYVGDGFGRIRATRRALEIEKETWKRRNGPPPGVGGPPPGFEESPRDSVDFWGQSFRGASFRDLYASPEVAPDRAQGYGNTETLVLGRGAERLRPEQWAAIRDWVIRGGGLILVDTGSSDAGPLATAEGRALSPLIGGLRPGAESLNNETLSGFLGDARLARRGLGLGTVLYCSVDLTDDRYREDAPRLRAAWVSLVVRARPFREQMAVSSLAQYDPWSAEAGWSPRPDDPFSVQVPPIKTVLFVFLGYFVLAVPVTFVVLRRTRRANLAWVTGPVLALGAAGVLYVQTNGAYSDRLSRRTSGVLIAQAGDTTGWFQGRTELFFPRAGTYELRTPSPADALGTEAMNNGFVEGNRWTDDGRIASARRTVGARAFERVTHEQRIPLGNGITADLRLGPDGRMVSGTITNGTGRTLEDAAIIWPRAWRKDSNVEMRTPVGTLPPGVTPLRKVALYASDIRYGVPPTDVYGNLMTRTGASTPAAPILKARTSGEPFGPTLGAWAGGDRTVTVLVGLPAPGDAEIDERDGRKGAKP